MTKIIQKKKLRSGKRKNTIAKEAMIEIAIGVAMLAAAIWLYRKGAREDARQGSQGAVILIVIGAIMAIHGLGLLEYRPMGSER